jgi:hypothetical protein
MLNELISHLADKPGRTTSLRMRRSLSAIEAAFDHGHTHEAIHATLVASGLKLTFKSYRRILARLRKEERDRTHKAAAPANASVVGKEIPRETVSLPAKPSYNASPDLARTTSSESRQRKAHSAASDKLTFDLNSVVNFFEQGK